MKTRFTFLALILMTNFTLAQQNVYYDVTAGNGNGLRLWSLDAYKIHMGYGTEYLYGPVTDYSIKSNMGGGNGRGWTWGGSGATPVAALNTLGTMQIAGTFTSSGLFTQGTGALGTTFQQKITTGSQTLALGANATAAEVQSQGGVPLYINYGGNNVILNATGGKVGIGTSSPDNLLTLNGGIGWFRTGTSPTGTSVGYINYVNAFTIGTASGNDPLNLQTNSVTRLSILNNGYVGIGTSSPDALLAVAGQVHAQEVKVSVTVPGPDYVFEKDYALTSLDSIKSYIDQNKHLPEIPSAKEMEKNGIQLGEMNLLLLKKIEELTLHLIDMKKELEAQQAEIERLKKK
ncbi:MAG: hypothetical protein JSS79_07575 [Bacteroidetes bacterium]|nr:hypothetical protein [Bacteroidota bacterium]